MKNIRKTIRDLFLAILISGLAVIILAFFFANYQRFDAIVIIFLLFITVTLGLYLSTRRYG
ncbi:MAG: hypothetical protein NC908_01170 [Candidatus Omnitrophica bacterium]|nr:hypothetical protein [Candidatus Omnitrophota bacterium]